MQQEKKLEILKKHYREYFKDSFPAERLEKVVNQALCIKEETEAIFNAMEEYAAAQHRGTSGWVKCSAQKPNVYKLIFKDKHGNIFKGNYSKQTGQYYAYGFPNAIWDVIEWLDESESPSKEGVVASEWIKSALQWAKEAIECASEHLQCPEPWVETWGNHYMNAMHAIQEAQREIDPNSEAVKAAQEAFLEGQSKEGNKEREPGQSNKDAVEFAEWVLENDIEATFNDKGKLWVDYRSPRGKNKFTSAQLYKLFKNRNNG